jgi:hypothetical protein
MGGVELGRLEQAEVELDPVVGGEGVGQQGREQQAGLPECVDDACLFRHALLPGR